ncbi:MAG: ATP-binding protein [Gammaproteobacteria bacterium]
MQRLIENELIAWKDQPDRMSLLLRGARQIGKTYVVESFGKTHFFNMLTINFERQREYLSCFESLEPQQILTAIQLISRESIIPGKTLLFLDEIQECPRAIMALRYFKEMLPELHIIGAGSLLEFALNSEDFRMPVGRVISLYMKPLSFKEFLMAMGYHELDNYLANIHLSTVVNPAVEQQLQTLLHRYFIVGGMPAVVDNYIKHNDLRQCQILQSALLSTYRDDFAKYATHAKHKYLQRLLEQAPGMVGQHFRYSRIDPDMQSRDLKQALEALLYAGIIYKIQQTSASDLPLSTQSNEKKFKLLFLDIGLVKASQMLDTELLQQKDLLLINRGAMAEQFVGQELLAYSDPYLPQQLYYWERDKQGSTAEVDYVISINENIIPLEVKAGKTGSLRSIQQFLTEKKQTIGVRLSMKSLSFENNILSVPLYLIHELKRLIKSV